MMPMETTCSIPTEESSFENIVIPNEDQTQMCFLPSNFDRLKHHRHRYPHISSALNREYIAPFRYQWDINNKTIPMGSYLQSGQYVNENDGNSYPMIPFSFALNPSLVSVDSTASIPNCNEMNSTRKNNYENHFQPYPVPNQQHRCGPSYALSTTSSMSTTVVSTTKTKRSKRIDRFSSIIHSHSSYNLEHARRIHRPSSEQLLPQYPSHFAKPIISNYWPSLPLPSMTNALTRPNECTFPVDLIRKSNFVPLSLPDLSIPSNSSSITIDHKSSSTTVEQHLLPHQTVGQCSLDHRYNHAQKRFNNSTVSNLSDNLPYRHYYMPPSNPMSMNIPTITCSTRLPQFDTTFSSRSLSNNMKELRQKRSDPHKSEAVENPLVEVQVSEKNVGSIPVVTKMPMLRRHGQKKPKKEDHRTRTLIKRMKQKNKLAILKFMIRKQKQRIAKKKLPEVKTEVVVSSIIDCDIAKPMEIQTKSSDLIASNLKITFNATQKIESISLFYHQRHKPQIKTDDSLITSNNTENRLDLLIEAVNFIEMYKDKSKLALESLD
jgi:hypothetical protein